jgi:hypothetical protein
MTEERIAAPVAGAPMVRCASAAPVTSRDRQIQKPAGFVPLAYGPGLVCGSTSVTSHINDHVEMGRTAWDGTPLGSPGAGYG